MSTHQSYDQFRREMLQGGIVDHAGYLEQALEGALEDQDVRALRSAALAVAEVRGRLTEATLLADALQWPLDAKLIHDLFLALGFKMTLKARTLEELKEAI